MSTGPGLVIDKPFIKKLTESLKRQANEFSHAATISIITNDGRIVVGTLRGFDQATNIILDESREKVYSNREGVQQLALGLYIIRGDNISVVGEFDEELDLVNDLSKIKAHPLKPVIH